MIGGSYRGEIGCCLTCTDYEKEKEVEGWNGLFGEGCLCFSCKCSRCTDQQLDGRCSIAVVARNEALARKRQFEEWVEDTKKQIREKISEKNRGALTAERLKFAIRYHQKKYFEEKLGRKRAKEVMSK